MKGPRIEIEHICSECLDAFPTAARLYTHLRDEGYSIEQARYHYKLARALDRLAMEAQWTPKRSGKSEIQKTRNDN